MNLHVPNLNNYEDSYLKVSCISIYETNVTSMFMFSQIISSKFLENRDKSI